MTVIEAIAQALQARATCEENGNLQWHAIWSDRLDHIARNALPSGSGVDSGTAIGMDSKPNAIKLYTQFHHMDDSGCYAGWTEHTVTIRPAFIGRFDLTISGRDRNDIKNYLGELFDHALRADYDYPAHE